MKVSYIKFNKHIAGNYEIQFKDIGGGSDEYDSLPKTFSFDLYYNPAVITLSPTLVLPLFPLEFRPDILCLMPLASIARLLFSHWLLLLLYCL